MTAATLNKINSAIAHHGIAVFKGNGYFYFYDLEEAETFRADEIRSVYSNTIRCMSLEQWIAYVDEAVAAIPTDDECNDETPGQGFRYRDYAGQGES